MQERRQLKEQYLQLLQEIERKINRQEFCKMHNVSVSKLSRILNGISMADMELLDYMCIHCNLNISMYVY